MIRKLKSAFLEQLKHAGTFDWVKESRWRREKLLILCYHGIAMEDEDQSPAAFSLSASVFEARLEALRSGGYSVLTLEDGLIKLYSHALPPQSVVLTFDDGMYNFYARAFPVLKKYRYPATVYVPTYYCYRQLPVFSLLCSYLFWKKREATVKPNPALGLSRPPDFTTMSGRYLARENIYAHAEKRRMNAGQKNELLKRLAEYLDLDFEYIVSKRLFHQMNPQEIKEISGNGMDVQMHSHRHRTPLNRVLFELEIMENRRKLEKLTGRRPRHFCYPSGVHKPQYLPWLSDLGVSSAVTCDHGFAHSETDPLLLPRFLDSPNVSPMKFESWLTGIAAWMPHG